MRNYFRDVRSLFFPEVCASCGKPLPEGGEFMCSGCRWSIPLTGFWKQSDNPVARKLKGLLPAQEACSFFYFVHRSGFREMIHGFKYRGSWRAAEKMGEWFGEELGESDLYRDIDFIVPIPLHIRKKLKRGYNQSEYIARGISSSMGVPLEEGLVKRVRHNASQTSRRKSERWENVTGIFAVDKNRDLDGKHILIVDDVLTTGATLASCGEAIAGAFPGCRISVATLAVSKSELESRKKS